MGGIGDKVPGSDPEQGSGPGERAWEGARHLADLLADLADPLCTGRFYVARPNRSQQSDKTLS